MKLPQNGHRFERWQDFAEPSQEFPNAHELVGFPYGGSVTRNNFLILHLQSQILVLPFCSRGTRQCQSERRREKKQSNKKRWKQIEWIDYEK